VPQKIVLVLLAVAVAAGLVIGRAVTISDPAPAASSEKESACGEVGLPAQKLGLERTRALTFCLLNEERAGRGLAPLRYEARLELASQRHSEDMAKRAFFEHDTPEGVEPYARMLAAGYPANNAFTGENIARGEGVESSPVEIVDSWMRSRPHREAILHPSFAEVGVGVAVAAPAALYTTDFGGPPLP
jgi:uncharacterized protein YkwD